MTKRSAGPEFRQQIRPIKNCIECLGKGLVKGLFYEMSCNHCGGSGIVDSSTEKPLSDQEMVKQLRLRLNDQAVQIRRLKEQIASHHQQDKGHGPMGKRYWGD